MDVQHRSHALRYSRWGTDADDAMPLNSAGGRLNLAPKIFDAVHETPDAREFTFDVKYAVVAADIQNRPAASHSDVIITH